MNELLGKISSYNLFNYLFTGVLFVILSDVFTSYSFTQENLVTGAFLYYFIGLLISRIGSFIVEPFLKWVGFIHFAEYSDFVEACKLDSKIDILSEENNTYRTLISTFLCLALLKAFEILMPKVCTNGAIEPAAFFLITSITLLFAYRKQTAYITKRIKSNLK